MLHFDGILVIVKNQLLQAAKDIKFTNASYAGMAGEITSHVKCSSFIKMELLLATDHMLPYAHKNHLSY